MTINEIRDMRKSAMAILATNGKTAVYYLMMMAYHQSYAKYWAMKNEMSKFEFHDKKYWALDTEMENMYSKLKTEIADATCENVSRETIEIEKYSDTVVTLKNIGWDEFVKIILSMDCDSDSMIELRDNGETLWDVENDHHYAGYMIGDNGEKIVFIRMPGWVFGYPKCDQWGEFMGYVGYIVGACNYGRNTMIGGGNNV